MPQFLQWDQVFPLPSFTKEAVPRPSHVALVNPSSMLTAAISPAAKRARPRGLEARVSSMRLPTNGWIKCLAVGKDGMVFGCTDSALYVVSPVWSLLAGSKTQTGFADGHGATVRFNGPRGLAVDLDGSLLVADTMNDRLRRVTMRGKVSTVAGSGEEGFADGVGVAARLHYPWGIVVDANRNIYFSDGTNHCIRKVAYADGAVSTLCGSPKIPGFADGPGADARFNRPAGLALDTNGNLIVADERNHCIRQVALPGGRVSMVTGSSAGGYAGKGFADGEGAAARFNYPSGVAVDGNNTILVADADNHLVRMIAGEGAWTSTLAGSVWGNVDGEGASVRFDRPYALALDERGRLLVAERENTNFLRVVKSSLLAPSRLAIGPVIREEVKDLEGHAGWHSKVRKGHGKDTVTGPANETFADFLRHSVEFE
jgi:DNA-binding beta-propeller fold protein YncE